MNVKVGKIFWLTLNELVHTQPPTPIHWDNITTAGIDNNTVNKHWSRYMEMKYFWACNQVKIGAFEVCWHPRQENLGDYTIKHHDTIYHQNMRPIYLHERKLPRYLPRALKPSNLQGCVGIKAGGYTWEVPLPLIHKYGPQASTTSYITDLYV